MASVLPPDGPVRDETVLDNPARSALLGPHSRFAQTHGNALRYPADVAPWCALPDDPTISDWEDAAELVGPDAVSYTHLTLPTIYSV